jgi:hypothetical protein
MQCLLMVDGYVFTPHHSPCQQLLQGQVCLLIQLIQLLTGGKDTEQIGIRGIMTEAREMLCHAQYVRDLALISHVDVLVGSMQRLCSPAAGLWGLVYKGKA